MDVGSWLRSLGLEQYEPAFRANAVDASILPKLTAEDLKELGVGAVGHRRKLLDAIAELPREARPEGVTASTDAPRGPDAGERRQVTVLFADLTGYTQLSTELDAEDLHALRAAFTQAADAVVAAHGGVVERHIGDSVMAVFGAPIARGNESERAVHAALAIREAMPGLSQRFGRCIDAHIGVASGGVVVAADPTDGSLTVTGEAVNLASRLTSAAPAGEIFISASIEAAIGDKVELAQAGTLSAKGFTEPVRAFRVVDARRAVAEPGHPFVGRQAELRQLRTAVDACLESETGQAIYVRGEAGIGKTRLLTEVQHYARAKGFACHVGIVLDFGMGAGRDPLRSIVRGLAGLHERDDAARAGELTQALISGGTIDPDLLVFVNDLLNVPQPPEVLAVFDAMSNAARARGSRETAAKLLQWAGRAQPRLLIVEDVHWADAGTLDGVSTLAEAVGECRALLLITSRLEGDPLAAGWRVGGACLTIDLAPLRASEAITLATALAPRTDMLVQQCIARAAGNPLFLEHLLRHAGERLGTVVPDSVQSVVQSRMDRLDPPERRALQAAAVFGQRVPLTGLQHLLGLPDYDGRALVTHHLLRRDGEELLFEHALVRDAAYATLLRSARREMHALAARWYQPRDLLLHAEHLALAEDPLAARAFLTAARQQAAAYRYQEALALAERGAAIARDGEDVVSLALCRGDLQHDLGTMNAAKAAYEHALAAAEDDIGRCRAWLGLAAVKRITDDLDGALIDLKQAKGAATILGLPAEAARAHFLHGNLLFPRGEIEGCLREHAISLDLARKAGSPELEAAALGGLGDAEYLRGRMLSARDRFQECVELSKRNGFGRIEVANRPMVAFARWFAGEAEGALADALAAIEAAAKVSHGRAEAIAHHAAYFCLHDELQIEAAQRHAERALLVAQQLGAKRFEAEALAFRGELHRLAGDRATAVNEIEEALAMSRAATGMAFLGPIILGCAALATSDPARRREALAEGEALLAQKSASHNHLLFRRDAIEACLGEGDWESTERHAAALEEFARPEPTPWTNFIVARARALARHHSGQRNGMLAAEIERLLGEASRLRFRFAMPALQAALGFC